ncbi:MAG: imidazole glycerol phosphate synthase subunit HisF [Rhodothermales bacterium]|nr:imidazole glycerol phosphate synthase subunit HisF [Rhodothermales bacterium]
MLTKRIIPCLDIRDGRTVKGVNFVGLRDAGDPVELAVRYCNELADELVFLDITATVEKRETFAALVADIAAAINIPFTVGGGISAVAHVETLLNAGADKVSVNSAAVREPDLIDRLVASFGSQCIVLAVDTRQTGREHVVHTHGGRTPTDRRTIEWIDEAVARGVGEILLTSMDHDGTKGGFACDITRTISERVRVPVIASGGAGTAEHFREVLDEGRADAALAASVFHFGEIPIPVLKAQLSDAGLPVRLAPTLAT